MKKIVIPAAIAAVLGTLAAVIVVMTHHKKTN